ncbi:MAG: hypothetical protein ACRD3C_24770 [Vicinamibacterales bacterium]
MQAGIILQVNSSPVINPVLNVGELTETVEVVASAAMVETRAVGVGQVMENERILSLPLNGRNLQARRFRQQCAPSDFRFACSTVSSGSVVAP